MAVHPVVLWAQRSSASEPAKNVVYLTIQVQDPQNVQLDLTANALKFSAQSADKATDYELNLEFYDEIDPENSFKHESGSHISYVLRKKTARAEYWPRVLKETLKWHYIKTDFDKWVDEDEQDGVAEDDPMAGMGGMPDMSAMGGMGGAGGMDFSLLLANSGVSGGAGGPGDDADIGALASQLGKSAGNSGAVGDAEDAEDAEAEDAEVEEVEDVEEVK